MPKTESTNDNNNSNLWSLWLVCCLELFLQFYLNQINDVVKIFKGCFFISLGVLTVHGVLKNAITCMLFCASAEWFELPVNLYGKYPYLKKQGTCIRQKYMFYCCIVRGLHHYSILSKLERKFHDQITFLKEFVLTPIDPSTLQLNFLTGWKISGVYNIFTLRFEVKSKKKKKIIFKTNFSL